MSTPKPSRLPFRLMILFSSGFFSIYAAFQFYQARIQYEAPFAGRIGQWLSALSDRIGLLPAGCLRFVSGGELLVAAPCFALCLFVGFSLLGGRHQWLHLLCKYRWWIGLALFALCIVLQWNSTSLREWANATSNAVVPGPLWGRSRLVRSDEWAVWTPLALSQSTVGYPALSPLIAGGGAETAWSSVGGIPAWNLAALFKPLYWGFLLFGADGFAYGLSWLWAARWILTALITFAFGLRITKRNRGLSFVMMLLVVFCPYIQWWYSQSVAEVLLFSEAALLCLWNYVDAESARKRCLYGILTMWVLGCLVMVAYPSWIIPQLEVTFALGVLILVQHRRRLHKRDAAMLAVPLFVVICGLLLVVANSRDALSAIADSVYPGNRLYTGGQIYSNLFTGLASALYSFTPPDIPNECELAGVFSLAPAGLLIGLDVLFLQKKKDGWLIVCMLLNAVYLSVMAFGLPAWLAKLTLFSQCTRLTYIIGVLDIFTLIRALALSERRMKLPVAILLTLLCTALNVWMASYAHLGNRQLLGYLFCGVVCLCLFYLVFSYHRPENRRLFAFLLTLVMLMCGGFVNPIERGTQIVEELAPVKAIRAVDSAEDANWLCVGGLPYCNLPLLAGKRTPYSTHEYPDVSFWRFFDPDGSQEDLYNSFVHVNCTLSDQPSAILPESQLAHLCLNINYHDLSALGIDYVLTTVAEHNDLLTKVASNGGWNVYQVSTKD